MNAAARVEFPALAPGGGPVCVPAPKPPAPPAFAGGVTPCAFRHATSVDRLVLELVLLDVEADLDAVVEALDEVLAELPQAAIAALEMTTASASEARRGLNMVYFIEVSFRDSWQQRSRRC